MTTNSNTTKTLSVDQTAVAAGAAVALNVSPLLGSAGVAGGLTGRKFRYRLPVLPGATGAPSSKIQTAPRIDPATGLTPAAGSAAWADTGVVLTSASEQEGEVYLDYYVRWNTTVAHAADAIVKVYLEAGV